MSRGRDDERKDVRETNVDRTSPGRPVSQQRSALNESVFARGLTLPHGDEREHVAFRGRAYAINGSETHALAPLVRFESSMSATSRRMRRAAAGFIATGVASARRDW